MFLTYKYRLLPTKRQHAALVGILESQRQLYNAALQERIDCYRKTGKGRTLKALAEWRQSDSEGAALPSNLQRWTLRRLEDAYAGFFRRLKSGGKSGFPRFRSQSRWSSFGFCGMAGLRFDGKRLRFKGMIGGIRVHLHRDLPDDAYCSDGVIIPNPRIASRAEKEMRRRQRALSRCKRDSKRRQKVRIQVAKLHRKIANTRSTWLHQQSSSLINRTDLVAAENLLVSNMVKNHNLARSINDAGWSKFLTMVAYKAEKAGKYFVTVDPRNTSKACSGCGELVPKSLSVRTHSCPSCGLSIDRDWNAALNILAAVAGRGTDNVAQVGRASVRKYQLL